MNKLEQKEIEQAINAGACAKSLPWLKVKQGHTLDEIADEHPDWWLWAVGQGVIINNDTTRPDFQARLERCVKAKPAVALAYCSKHLSKEKLAELTDMFPKVALKRCSDLLGKKQFNRLVGEHPGSALKYAQHRLSKKQIKDCSKKDPIVANRHVHGNRH